MPDLSSFLNELKRRKMVRAAVVYAGVAWLVVEAASVVVPALHLPPWTLTFLVVVAILGFPLALALEWVFEVTSSGVRRTEGAEADTAGDSLLLHPAVIGVILALVVGVGVWQLLPAKIDGESATTPMVETGLAILPFEVDGSSDLQYLRNGMADLLATKLAGTAAVQPLDPRAVLSFLDREALEPSDPSVAGRVSRRFGAGWFLQGSILEHSGQLQVRAAVYGLEGDEPLVEAAVEGEADELFALVDDLAAEILAGMPSPAAGPLTALAALTTDSLRALKAYLEGEGAYRDGRWSEAVGGYEEAVAIDSTFALAYYRLSSAAGWAEREELSTSAMEAALRHDARLAPRHRKLLLGYAAYRTGRHAEGARLNREIVETYPEVMEGWYQLGEVLVHEGYLHGADPQAGADAFRRAAELELDFYPALRHLLEELMALGRPAEELDNLTARILRQNPDNVDARRWQILYRNGSAERDSLIALLRSEAVPFSLIYYIYFSPTPAMAERFGGGLTGSRHAREWRAVGHALQAQARAAGGRWREARASLAELQDLDRALGLEMRAHLALLAPEDLAADELEPLQSALEDWDGHGIEPPDATRGFRTPHAGLHPYLRLYLLGLVEARLGRGASALQRANALADASPPSELVDFVTDLAAVVRAEVAREEADPRRALTLLEGATLWTEHPLDERISPLVGHLYPVFLRAELLRESGRERDALRWYRVYSRLPRLPPTTLALLRRAQIHDALGEPDQAAALYAEVEQRWAGAEPELRDLLRVEW